MLKKNRLFLIIFTLIIIAIFQIFVDRKQSNDHKRPLAQPLQTGTSLHYVVESHLEIKDQHTKKVLKLQNDRFQLIQKILSFNDKQFISVFNPRGKILEKDIPNLEFYVLSDQTGIQKDIIVEHTNESEADPWIISYLELIISRMQITTKDNPNTFPKKWKQIERDQYGFYVAVYNSNSPKYASFIELQKSITNYNQTVSKDTASLLPSETIQTMSTRPLNIKIRKHDLFLESLEGKTAHLVKQDNNHVQIEHKLNIHLVNIEYTREQRDFKIDLKKFRADRTRQKQLTLDKKNNPLLEIEQILSQENPNLLHANFSNSVDYYRNFPEKLPEVKVKILDINPQDPLHMQKISYLVGILAEQTSSISEQILADLLHQDNNTTIIQSISAISDLKSPTNISLETLIQFSEDPSRSDDHKQLALLALGSITSRLRSDFSMDHQSGTDYLIQQGELLPLEKKIEIIDALGNDGSTSHLPFITRFLNHEDYIIRGRAIYQLRKIQGYHVEQLILSQLKEESEPFVWQEAIKALNNRKSSKHLVNTIYELVHQALTPQLQYELIITMMLKGSCCINTVEENLRNLQRDIHHMKNDLTIWLNHLEGNTMNEDTQKED